MQDLFENAKRVANSAVERAAWEADRLRRTTARQHDIDVAQRERGALLDQLANVVLDLERRGQLTQPPLEALAQRLKALEDEVNRAQVDLLAIRKEAYPSASGGPSPRTSIEETEACPTCGQLNRRTAAYCNNCGARLR